MTSKRKTIWKGKRGTFHLPFKAQLSFCRSLIVSALVMSVLIYSTACTYYRVAYTSPDRLTRTQHYNNQDHYQFFLHHDEGISMMNRVRVDSGFIHAKVSPADPRLIQYDPNAKGRRLTQENTGVTKEAHIHLLPDYDVPDYGEVTIPAQSVNYIEVLKGDPLSTILILLGVALAIMIIATLIILLTKSSCPYVYTFNGEEWQFEGEIYSGAVQKNMERTDHLKLSSNVNDTLYRIRIANELQERQYVNNASLIYVDHDTMTNALADSDGSILLAKNPTAPAVATNTLGEDVLSALTFKDTNYYSFNAMDTSMNELKLKFRKEEERDTAVLVLTGRNSLWGDYVYGEFLKKFGRNHKRWVRKQKSMSRSERMEKAENSGMLLSIYSLTADSTWSLVDHQYFVGPLGEREMVHYIDISDNTTEWVELKLVTGFMFWDLNKVVMHYDYRKASPVYEVHPSVRPNVTNAELKALESKDKSYYVQSKPGKSIDLDFVVPTYDGQRSAFLKVGGYYEHIRHFKGKADIAELQKFKEHEYFGEFSRSEYVRITAQSNSIAQVKGE